MKGESGRGSRVDREVEILVNGRAGQRPWRTDGHTGGVELIL